MFTQTIKAVLHQSFYSTFLVCLALYSYWYRSTWVSSKQHTKAQSIAGKKALWKMSLLPHTTIAGSDASILSLGLSQDCYVLERMSWPSYCHVFRFSFNGFIVMQGFKT